MSTTIKDRILLELARRGGRVKDPLELVTGVGQGAGVHSIVHVLWRLRRDGLVAFRESKVGRANVPRDIEITSLGVRRISRLR